MNPANLLPLGIPLGAHFAAEHSNPQGRVRRQGELDLLSPSEYDAWMQLHVDTSVAALHEWTETLDDPFEVDSTLDLLKAKSLVVPWPEDRQSRVNLVSHLVLIPSALALGNSATDPDRFVLGMQDLTALVVLEAGVFEVWARCDGRMDLASVCKVTAEAIGRDIGHLIVSVSDAITDLLASRTAHLD